MTDRQDPAAGAHEALNREALLAALNELLEAERAGARLSLSTVVEADDPAFKTLIASIHLDEVKWCGVLIAAIRALRATPSSKTGAFYDKAMAIPDLRDRMAFLNRGQGWVVKRLRALLPHIHQPEIQAGLSEMLSAHQTNIDRVDALLLSGA
ncbi:MAG: DUF6306 domain-containing protein [Burkholderiaceae bacterium]